MINTHDILETINMINNLGLSLIGMVGAALYLLGGVGMEQISSLRALLPQILRPDQRNRQHHQ